ncbi:MAG: hypothetical protein ACKVRN_09660 [Pyrinomonadaceae bacterium]
MTNNTEKTLNEAKITEQENSKVFDALASASALYDRYVEIVDVANIAAFQQSLPSRDIQAPPPLGLVIWPQK